MTTTPHHEMLDRYLAAGALCPTLSEAHGMLCGLICGGDPQPESHWLSQLEPDPDAGSASEVAATLASEGRRALAGLARETLDALDDVDLGFRLLLPDDARPLAERALALYDWVRGFLYAWGTLAHAGVEPSAEVQEVLRDFTGITQMDLHQLDEDEHNEEAFAEVSEFVRIAAMLIYQERVLGARAARDPRS